MNEIVESDTNRDGFVSYPDEVHALGYGLAGGFIAGITYGTGFQGVGIGVILAVVATALGIKGMEKLSRSNVVTELHREPQYAVGFIPVGFAVAVVLRVALQLL